jgi:glucan 1,3-beta-glucosidase
MGTTGQPAIVYLPAGTYLMANSLQLYVGTVIVGNALSPPVLKASSNFPNDHIVYAKDPNLPGTSNFYIALKNVVLDSTSVPASQTIALLDWTVSQGTQLANVVFNMPDYSNHTGITSQYDYNSLTILVRIAICLHSGFHMPNLGVLYMLTRLARMTSPSLAVPSPWL